MDLQEKRSTLLERQVQRLERRISRLRQQTRHLSNWRLFCFLAGTAVSLVTLWQFGLWPWAGVSALAVGIFAYLVWQHRRVEEALTRHVTWQKIKQTHLARMNLDWEAIPETLPAAVDGDHPFARDLDITGPRSLHRLLDTAVSRQGSVRLREWLLETVPNPEATHNRQKLVQEIASLTSFRDRLILHAAMATNDPAAAIATADKWSSQGILDWLEGTARAPFAKRSLVILGVLSLITIALLLVDLLGQIGPWWLITWLPYAIYTAWQIRLIGGLFADAAYLADGLRKLQAIFSLLENYQAKSKPHLVALCYPFHDPQKRPSVQLQRVSRIVAGAGIKNNPVLWFLLNFLTPWDVFFAYRMELARHDLSRLLPSWLETLTQLEAANSLANFAYLHPENVYPRLGTEHNRPLYQATALGHPLIPAHKRVHNDANFQQPGQIYLITGSNMAGKSTYLRTLGINLVLAYAGSPVVAKTFHAAYFRLYSSIQVTDSLADGYSSFYAEVRRLQALLAALQQNHPFPLFFLIDEIFRGTNNRERLLGSREYVRALACSQGMGAIATHDLELIKLAADFPGIGNFHFRDAVQEGQMVFDYQLHPGPCPTTNALKIMALAGLPIPAPLPGEE